MSDVSIGEGTAVTLHFALRLADGDAVDTTFGNAPAMFRFGDDNLPEPFQKLLMGMVAGDRRVFRVLPEQAFGQRHPGNLQEFPRRQFGADIPLEVGMILSFSDASKAELPGVVSELREDVVLIDFNHPLAGKELDFDVEILDVQRVD